MPDNGHQLDPGPDRQMDASPDGHRSGWAPRGCQPRRTLPQNVHGPEGHRPARVLPWSHWPSGPCPSHKHPPNKVSARTAAQPLGRKGKLRHGVVGGCGVPHPCVGVHVHTRDLCPSGQPKLSPPWRPPGPHPGPSWGRPPSPPSPQRCPRTTPRCGAPVLPALPPVHSET